MLIFFNFFLLFAMEGCTCGKCGIFTEEDNDIVLNLQIHFSEIFKCPYDLIDQQLYIGGVHYYKTYNQLPSLKIFSDLLYASSIYKLAEQMIAEEKPGIPGEELDDIVDYQIEYFGSMDYKILKGLTDYWIYEHKLATRKELQDYFNHLDEMKDTTVGSTKEEPTKNLEKLKSVKMTEPTKEVCSICLENFNEGDLVFTLKCKHQFHDALPGGCLGLKEWLSKHDTCPMCMAKIDDL